MSPNRKNRHRSCSLPRRHVRASVIDTLRPERNAGGRSSAAQPQETPAAAGAADSGAGQEPAPGSAEALAVLAALGIAPRAWTGDTLGPDDKRFSPLAIGHATHRLVELKQRLDQLTAEQKQLQETLRLAHLRGDLLHLLRPEADGGGYQLTGGVVLHRRSGRRQWRYNPACSELKAQLKARQTYEQASGQASWRLGPAFWELRFAKG